MSNDETEFWYLQYENNLKGESVCDLWFPLYRVCVLYYDECRLLIAFTDKGDRTDLSPLCRAIKLKSTALYTYANVQPEIRIGVFTRPFEGSIKEIAFMFGDKPETPMHF